MDQNSEANGITKRPSRSVVEIVQPSKKQASDQIPRRSNRIDKQPEENSAQSMNLSNNSRNTPGQSITEKISKMPSHLQVFISNSLDLNQRKITKDMITEIIKYFHSQWKPPPRKTKAILISCFEDLVKPLIVNYQTSSAPQNIAEAKPIITDQPQIDLSLLNPNDTRFTADHIISILQDCVPQIKLCKQMNKKLAIFYYEKYIQP
ncbi:hypothetical protein BY996DRAFT_6565845 [Phakopsora pachyrhizi]|uniref:Uncharacterized protein n=1 Tax=Phakopsora pachyrhizi TaxID=170000 RepID=A0AAV0BBR8_PHAPC|nr:hypothetical protein BY996DRAFT_6565845 [Phakopsora pachyrhizi]CAH7683658.1 hypothetical protein PPACK8108_LOCUS17296 [Phakopsora pachyrhizi]